MGVPKVAGCTKLAVAISRLIGVIEFLLQVGGIVCVQHICRVAVFDRPYDGVFRPCWPTR